MTEDELRDLSERVQAIRQLTEGIGWDLFVDRAKAELEKHQRLILGGRLEQGDYQREAGWVQGALAIISLPDQAWQELLKARVRFDEEREQESEEVEGAFA